jgi:antitoxin MazE2
LRKALHQHLIRLRGKADVASWERFPPTDAEQSLAQIADWGPVEDWTDWIDGELR